MFARAIFCDACGDVAASIGEALSTLCDLPEENFVSREEMIERAI